MVFLLVMRDLQITGDKCAGSEGGWKTAGWVGETRRGGEGRNKL